MRQVRSYSGSIDNIEETELKNRLSNSRKKKRQARKAPESPRSPTGCFSAEERGAGRSRLGCVRTLFISVEEKNKKYEPAAPRTTALTIFLLFYQGGDGKKDESMQSKISRYRPARMKHIIRVHLYKLCAACCCESPFSSTCHSSTIASKGCMCVCVCV